MNAAPIDGVDHDRHRPYTAHIVQALREDYRLLADEAERAVGLYVRRKAGWVTPDHAAFEAYRWWAPTVTPAIVLDREAEQRAHPRHAVQVGSSPLGPSAETLHQTSHGQRSGATREDLAAAESALAMIRDHGRRHGFLRQVLDESAVWDTITLGESILERTPMQADLEPPLRPNTVRERDDWDDMIVIDAAFAGTTVTVLRAPGGLEPSSYVCLCGSPGSRGAQHAVDVTTIGMIAAGDRTPDPARAGEYESLGAQVRNHLIGLADAVAESRQAWQEQQTNHLQKALASNAAPIVTGRGPDRASIGRAR